MLQNLVAMLLIFHKYSLEICLCLLVLFGLAGGRLAATITGMLLRPTDVAMSAEQAYRPRTNNQTTPEDLNKILEQNIFDPSARGKRLTSLEPARQPQTVSSRTRSDLVLVGTLVAAADSMVLIEIDREIKLFHLNSELPSGGRIESILRNQVTIRNRDGSTTELVMQDDLSSPPAAGKTAAGSPGIRSQGENRWTVSRTAAEAARTNIADQLRLAQMEPRVINGQTDGFLVRKLNPKSLLVAMGIKRGDVILRVNNMTLDSPEKALQILQQLREARQLTVDLERRQQPMTFVYEID